MSNRILLVDDDRNVLQGYRRQLHSQFELEFAEDGGQALELLRTRGPFAVLVCDMRMPAMDGVAILAAATDIAPETVRIMLTGDVDQKTAIAAVNDGHVFRFLTKPCPAEVLASAIRAGVQQYELVTAEKNLIQQTLTGSVKVLTDVLSLVNHTAFGLVTKIRPLVRELAADLKAEKAWECELAAMLCQIGCVTIPEATMVKAISHQDLSPEERVQYHHHPKIGHDLLANIARLEGVAKIVLYQQKHFDGRGFPADGVKGEAIPLGARILKVAIDVNRLAPHGGDRGQALAEMRQRTGDYDPRVLAALAARVPSQPAMTPIPVTLSDLREGQVLAEEVQSTSGITLMGKGQVVTDSLRLRLLIFSKSASVREPILVYAPAPSPPPVASFPTITPMVTQ